MRFNPNRDDLPQVFRFPTTDQRTVIIGSTGSGKSVLGAHVLSKMPYHKMPFVIIDYKNERLLNSIHYAKQIGLNETPKRPGVYIMKAIPKSDDEQVENFLWRVLARERVGLFFDEGYMVPNIASLNAIYTQGRSKHIPVITLTQRPVWLTRFSFSEANHIGYLRLNDREDRKQIRRFVPADNVWDNIMETDLPKYNARWYDVDQHESFWLRPAPAPDRILQVFDDRLRHRRKVY